MSDLEYISSIELIDNEESNDAFAEISLNPTYQWAKIVVTDDIPNENKCKIPLEEFDNMIKTGIFAPVKMDAGMISGHKESMGKPIGILTQFLKSNNKLIALAALWKRERPNDIELLKKMYAEGYPPNVSWEVSYENSEKENDVDVLRGVSLNGLAIVKSPAYAGRTPFIAIASTENNQEEVVEEIEQLKQQIADLQSKLDELTRETSEKDTELVELRTYKAEIENEKIKQEKLANIKTKFLEAGLNKDDEYWSANQDTLLKMDESTLDFVIQELHSFIKTNTSDSEKLEVPDLSGKNTKKLSPRELGIALRELK